MKNVFLNSFLVKKKKDTAQWRIQGRGPGGPPPLIFDQNEARRTEKIFLGDRPPLSQGLDEPPPPPPLSEGLDPPLLLAKLYYYYCQLLVLLLTKMAAFSRGCKSRITLITE